MTINSAFVSRDTDHTAPKERSSLAFATLPLVFVVLMLSISAVF